MRFILIYLKALFIQSFIFTPIPIISNHFYPFLPNSQNFKQTLSIACL